MNHGTELEEWGWELRQHGNGSGNMGNQGGNERNAKIQGGN